MAGSPPRRKPRLEVEEAAPTPPDLLSSLPLEVLDKILSRVHIYDVVRTAALSREWRRRWESLPTVDLTRSPGILASEIDALLLRRTAPIRTFRLAAFSNSWYIDALYDWILYLSRNGVENLFLWFPQHDIRLHSSLFSCRELTSLSLTSCRLPPAPQEFVGFPSLKILLLDEVVISEHGGRELAALINSSPLIEVVSLMSVELIGDHPEDDWVIRAPNLQKLTIAGGFPYGGRIEHLPRLQLGIINGCNYAKFLMGMAQVTNLQFGTLSSRSTEVDVLDRLPFLFENLRTLAISVDFTKMAPILSFFCLLRSAPVLEELEVVGPTDCNLAEEFKADDDFLSIQWADNMFAKLQVVQMNRIMCICNVMHLMEFILSKAGVLKVLSVRFAPDALCVDKAIIAIKGYPRASPDAQVIILSNDSANIGSTITTSSKTTKVEETQTTSRRHDSIDTPTENAEVEEAQTAGCAHDSVNAFTEKAGVDETHTTSCVHDSFDMSPENADVGEAQTTGSSHDSMDTAENAKVESEQKTEGGGHGSVNTFTKNSAVDGTQTVSSELVYDVHPLRRKRLDLESLAQLEQLKEDKLELQQQILMVLDHKKEALEHRICARDSFIRLRNMGFSIKSMCQLAGITLPPFPELSSAMSSLLANSGVGSTPVNPGVGGATDDRAVSP